MRMALPPVGAGLRDVVVRLAVPGQGQQARRGVPEAADLDDAYYNMPALSSCLTPARSAPCRVGGTY
jgi:hypothetical protein